MSENSLINTVFKNKSFMKGLPGEFEMQKLLKIRVN
jgi:hypothetical protein